MSAAVQRTYAGTVSDGGVAAEDRPFEAVVLVASLGGIGALTTVLGSLPSAFPVPVAVVQHGRLNFDGELLGHLLARRTALPLRTAAPGMAFHQAGVTVVPTGWDATLDTAGRYVLTSSDGAHGGDGLLAAVAGLAGPAAIGVVLTGLQRDGARGVQEVKRRGGRVLVEDPATARGKGMPSAAIATGCVDFVLPLDRIGPALVALAMAPGGAALLTVPTPSWARLPA